MSIVTKNFTSGEDAEAARRRLADIGIASGSIRIRAPAEKAGMFDHFTSLVTGRDRDGWHLSAEIAEERVVRARLVLEGRPMAVLSPREQIFEFAETRQALRVEKEPFVREEIVVRKEALETVADIHGALRHTKVEIDEIPPGPDAAGGPRHK